MSSYNYLDKTGLGELWAKVKNITPTRTSQLVNDSGYVTQDTNTTYTMSMTNNIITLTASNGTTSTITLPVYDGGVTETWNGGSY